ncbi:MAG: hypothetical protein JKY48_12415 [Flavobacteriales bacterium]|nr:hypothetical protein [Flavobacteriales bacterium]
MTETKENSVYRKAKNKLQQYIEKEKFKGYDPYDTLNSWVPFGWLGKWGKPIGIQIQKRNPINVRSLIGIRKEYNPKAIGLLLHAYSIMYQQQKSNDVKEKLDFLFNWLIENRTVNFNHYCWGYNFDWASSEKLLPAYSPTIVVSGFISKGIVAYYEATKDPKALKILISIGNFIEENLALSKDASGICFSYSTIEKDCCYNASMLGSELFATLYYYTKEDRYKDLALKSTDFVVDKQKDDGRWNYSIKLDTGKERTQIDFHQGYVLDSLASVVKYIPTSATKYTEALKLGLSYYKKYQFLDNGQSYYRVPKKWPVEIHNQAQGIITFSRLSNLNSGDLSFSKEIANYTIKNMFSPQGYFFYKKYPWVSIKTPFMRWSQAWMFLALNELEFASNK